MQDEPISDSPLYKRGYADGRRAAEAEMRSALDLMRSLSINPLIPEGLRIMMKESLDR